MCDEIVFEFVVVDLVLLKRSVIVFLANDEDENDHLSSRLSKTSQLIYRLAGFLCLLENAVKIVDAYLADFGSFDDGQPNWIFFEQIQSIVQKSMIIC